MTGTGERTRSNGTRTPGLPRRHDRGRLEERSDEALVARHLEGDELAFQVLADRYRAQLVGWLTRKGNDRAEAEDLAQQTFMRVYRHLHRFDPEKKFSTWLYTIAGNLLKNVFRDRSRDPVVLYQTLTRESDHGDRPIQWEDLEYLPDEMARRRDLRELVDRTVEELPEHQREAFVLREREGRSYREIAELTGVKLGTVKSRLNRARSRFAELISEELDAMETAT